MIGIEWVGFALLLIIIVAWRRDIFFVQKSGDFTVAITLTPVIENLADNSGGGFVNNKLVFIIRRLFVAERSVTAQVFAGSRARPFNRFDLFACVTTLKFVEQIPKGHDVVVVMNSIDAIVQCDKATPDHGEKVIRELPDLYVVASKPAQILDQY